MYTVEQIQTLVTKANAVGVKLLGRRVVVESVENRRMAILRDPEHPSIAIRVPLQRVETALAVEGHWVPLPRRHA